MEWSITAQEVLRIALAALGIYVVTIAVARSNGLRTFSTMSGFDFAITVAFGSLIATTVLNPRPNLVQAGLALTFLVLLQRSVALLRQHTRLHHLFDNDPLLLMRRATFLHDNMRKARVTEQDILSKLRGNGVARLEDVEAVVFETTGTVSVIKRSDAFDERMLEGVRRE